MNKTLNLIVILVLLAVFIACFIHTRDYSMLISIPFFVSAILDNFGEKLVSRIFLVIALVLVAIRVIADVLQIF